MLDKVIENGEILVFIPGSYNDQKICVFNRNNAADNYSHTLRFVPEH